MSAKVVSLQVPNRHAAPLTLTQRDDDELMLLARAGRKEAFDMLVRRYQQRTLKTAARYLGDPTLAVEAVQQAFVELLRYTPTYRPEGKFGAFLYRIVINQCRMLLRKQASSNRLLQQFEQHPNGPHPWPDDALIERQRRLILDEALMQLPPKHRAAIALRFAGDCSYQEIADALAIPLGTVKSRIANGLAMLRQLLGDAKP